MSKVTMLKFTEVMSGNQVAVNPSAIVAVFCAMEGDHIGKTIIAVSNGSIVVEQSVSEVLGSIASAE